MSPWANSTRPWAQSRRASSLADEADDASVKPRVAPSSGAADGCGEALARSAIASLLKAGSFCAVGAGAAGATTVVLFAAAGGETGVAAAGAGAAAEGTAEASLTGVALRTKTGFSTPALAPASDLSNCGQNAKPSAMASAAALTPAPILIIWDISGLPIIAPPRSNA